MSHQINYTFQPVNCCVSNRFTLQALGLGRYTVANLATRVLLLARISKTFGVVITIGRQSQQPNKKDRLYTHFSSDTLHIRKNNLTLYECELPPQTTWKQELNSFPDVIKRTAASRQRDLIVSLLIVQEIGGLRCNETKRIELQVQTTRTINPKNIIDTRD